MRKIYLSITLCLIYSVFTAAAWADIYVTDDSTYMAAANTINGETVTGSVILSPGKTLIFNNVTPATKSRYFPEVTTISSNGGTLRYDYLYQTSPSAANSGNFVATSTAADNYARVNVNWSSFSGNIEIQDGRWRVDQFSATDNTYLLSDKITFKVINNDDGTPGTGCIYMTGNSSCNAYLNSSYGAYNEKYGALRLAADNIKFNGNIYLTDNATISASHNNTTISGDISGNHNLTLNVSKDKTFKITGRNLTTGTTSINNTSLRSEFTGTVEISQAPAGNIHIQGGTLKYLASELNSDATINSGATIQLTAAKLDLSGKLSVLGTLTVPSNFILNLKENAVCEIPVLKSAPLTLLSKIHFKSDTPGAGTVTLIDSGADLHTNLGLDAISTDFSGKLVLGNFRTTGVTPTTLGRFTAISSGARGQIMFHSSTDSAAEGVYGAQTSYEIAGVGDGYSTTESYGAIRIHANATLLGGMKLTDNARIGVNDTLTGILAGNITSNKNSTGNPYTLQVRTSSRDVTAGGFFIFTGTNNGEDGYGATEILSGGTLQVGFLGTKTYADGSSYTSDGMTGTLGTGRTTVKNNAVLRFQRAPSASVLNVAGILLEAGSKLEVNSGNISTVGFSASGSAEMVINENVSFRTQEKASVLANSIPNLTVTGSGKWELSLDSTDSVMDITTNTFFQHMNGFNGSLHLSSGKINITADQDISFIQTHLYGTSQLALGNATFTGHLHLGDLPSDAGNYQAAVLLEENATLAGTISLKNGSNVEIINTQNNAEISAIISGSGNFVRNDMTSLGTIILSGNNDYTGKTILSYGITQVGNGGNSGSLGSGDVEIKNGAQLNFMRNGDVTVMNQLHLEDGANVSITQGTWTFTGNINSDVITPAGNISLNGGSLIFQAETEQTIHTNLSGGSITFNAESEDAHIYFLGDINDCDVMLDGAGKKSLKNKDGGSVQMGTLTLNAGTFSPGNSLGSINVANFNQKTDSTLLFEIGSESADFLNVDNMVTLEDGISVLGQILEKPNENVTYHLMSYSSITDNSGINWNTWADMLGPGWSSGMENNSLVVRYSTDNPVPEPYSWILLLTGTIGMICFRRGIIRRSV